MADSVLGQDPIIPNSINPSELEKGAVEGIDKLSYKDRVAARQNKNQGVLPSRDITLPVDYNKFTKRLGVYAPAEGENVYENLAQDQTGAEQMAYFIPRVATKALIEAAKIPGFVGGVLDWASEGFDPNKYGESFNNGWNIALDNFNKTIQEEGLPVYTPEAVQDGNIWDKLKSTSLFKTLFQLKVKIQILSQIYFEYFKF